jgi:multidrug efflux system membrane fusion protein
MNIRFPDSLQTMPAAVQSFPDRVRRTSSRTRLIVGIVATLLVAFIAWKIFGGTAPAKPAAPPVLVTVGVAQRQDVPVVEHTIGTILAESTVQLTPQVTGQMLSANFTEGQIVHQGDILFQIDPRPFQAALAQANATLAKDQASLVSAQNDERRYSALFAQGASSQQLRDQAVATAKGFAASVQSDRAAIDVAKLNLGYATIRSPITGKTGPILIQPGNVVTANGGSPLVTITQVQPVKVSFFLPQNDLAQIQAQMSSGGLQAVIPMPGAAGNRETAGVDFVGNAVSAQTGTIELRATFANTDLRLVPGQTVDVGATLRTIKGAIVVPRNAVNLGPDKSFIFVLTPQMKVVSKPVTVLHDDGTNDAVQGDIKPGQKVVTEGGLRIVDGSSVTINKHPGPPTVQAPTGSQ